MSQVLPQRTRAQESRAAIRRLYIAMRHLFIRGNYKPLGVSGEAMIEALMALRPEIYGSIADPERVELDGLLYVFQRLPKGIEECRFIKLISKEGFENSNFPVIIAPKRRRNSYRIDEEQMYIEMTRGRSDIYDILTHLTFLYVEAEKIRRNSEDTKGRKRREWLMLEEIVKQEDAGEDVNKEVAYTYLSTLLGRTYEETINACSRFAKDPDVNSIFHITYWLGKLSQQEEYEKLDREISFSSALREKVGHHYLGELWAQHIKQFLWDNNLFDRPIHIISANLHSVMNSLFASSALQGKLGADTIENMARKLSLEKNQKLRNIIRQHANKNGMYMLNDTSGMNINVQIIDVHRIANAMLPKEIEWSEEYVHNEKPIILVMDYAFGEQAYETMDELLKPFEKDDEKIPFNVQSVSVMGKAGILEGIKGDIMVATAHVFEGAADNYPVENELSKADFEGHGLAVYEGPMITVLGTSLQNRDILRYFLKASWHAVGLEMEGAHYQKAIQAASKIRNSVRSDIAVRYAYYASDNPLVTGHTLASGSLGVDGVKPTYLITIKILNQILSGK
ncbi:MAG: hypothetical protein MK226_20505 [Saprospiraceae bacterium]|nr:hypothetical protein [Saprospiraceae bacterium]